MQFLAAPLLFGLVLAGVPVLIHLLNRRRFQLVEWAPMKYLKLTIRSNRRRMRIEQFLLLALRTLLMILVIVIVARPILSSSALGAWLSHRARTTRVIVLDDSLSMGYRQGGRTALDLGKDAAAEILHRTGAQDAVTFLTTEPAADPLVRDASLEDPTRLLSRIDALQPTDAACNWAAVFKSVDDSLKSAAFPQKQLVLITDLRRSGWSSGVTEFTNRWAALGVETKLIDVGSRDTANVSLASFVQEDPIALPGSPVKLSAMIRNDTPSPINGGQAALSVDGQTRPIMLPDLPAGATTTVPLSAVFNTPGQHTLHLAIGDDALNGDNARFLDVNVRPSLNLALIDGRQGAGPFESAGDFLDVALTVRQGAWHVQEMGDGDPAAVHLPDVDAAALVDVATITPAMASEYARRVRQGMGLIIFPGEQIDLQSYNDRLFASGLLPMKLDHVIDGPVQGIVVEGFADSPLASLGKIAPAALAKISTRRFVGVEAPLKPADGVRVLARWNDPEGHPAIIEKRLGKGRVIFWTTTADREWTDWPVDPTYVLAARSAALSIARPDAREDNIVAGQMMEYRAVDDHPRISPRIVGPGDPTPQPLVSDGSILRYPHTARAGIYTLSWKDAVGADQSHRIAVSFDKTASDLQPLTETQLDQLAGNLPLQIVHYHAGQLAASSSGREIWRTLAACLLGLLFVESLLAFYVGREK
jgi:hypothetical protein